MLSKAIQYNVPVSNRKASLVCTLIRDKNVNDAIKILENTPQKSAKLLKKLLFSALSNAVNNHNMIGEKLYIFTCVANQGRTLKRTTPRAKGSSNLTRKRSSHLVIELSDNRELKSIRNKYLLKPRAHQHKYMTKDNKSIKVESQLIKNNSK